MNTQKNQSTTQGALLRALVVLTIALGTAPFLGAPMAGAMEPAGVRGGLTAGEWSIPWELVAAAQYQVAWQTWDGVGAYRALNPAQGFGLAFAPDGLNIAGYQVDGMAAWDLKLRPVAYGEQVVPPTPSDLRVHRSQVTYRWSDSLTEWYENRSDGVKHGLTLHTAPPGADERVEITFALQGSLFPYLDADGQTVRLQDGAGNTVLLYDQLAVSDATGRVLPAQLALRGTQLVIAIDDSAALYPLTVDPIFHDQMAVLHASDAQADDVFGYAVAVSGDTLVVGARGEDGGPGDPLDRAGAAYVFERDWGGMNNWGQVTKLTASDARAADWFGHSAAISGDIIVVGAPQEDGGAGNPLENSGAAYVFYRNQGGANNWGQVKILHASDAQATDWFGYSVAIDGNTIAVGAIFEDGGPGDPILTAGAAYVFDRDEGGADNWGEVRILHASDAQEADELGYSVAISGNTVVVGAEFEDGGPGDPITGAGAAYVFDRDWGGIDNWGQVKILHASDAQVGDDFSYSVAISGSTVVVGARLEDGGLGDPHSNAGATYVYYRSQGGANNWGEVKILHPSDAQDGDQFGYAVAIDSDTLVVGARYEDGGPGDPLVDSGEVYHLDRNQGGANNWGQVEVLRAGDSQAYDEFGSWVTVDGEIIIVGAWWEDGGAGDPANNAGAAYVFGPADTAPPETTLTSTPPNPDNDSTPTFTFTGSDTGGSGLAGFECRMDGSGWSTCSSPYTTPGLRDGSHTFGVRAVDGAGNRDLSPPSYTWTVDTTPPNANNDSGTGYSTDENTPFTTGNVLGNDNDPGGGTIDLVSYDDSTLIGTLTYNDNGTFTFDPDGQFEQLGAGEQVEDTFAYTIADRVDLTDSALVTIRVIGVNDGPTISDIPDQVTKAGTPVGPIAFTVDDIDTPAVSLSLSFTTSNPTLVNPLSGISFGGSGTERTLLIMPSSGITGMAMITITVSDGDLETSDTFLLTVGAHSIYLPLALRR